MTRQDKQRAIDALITHHSSQAYRPEAHYTNLVNADGEYPGPYVPYVGESYFTTKPRILIYAMAQNLARYPGLVTSYLRSYDRGMVRHYYDQATPDIDVGPYDNGHLKVVGALALSVFPGTSFQPSHNVHESVAVTNFVKFSFFREDENKKRLDVNPPQDIYGAMWEHYCKYEIQLLQPDIVIAVGNDVAGALAVATKGDTPCYIIAKVPFPGRLNLNSRWVPNGKRLVAAQGCGLASEEKARIRALVVGTPDDNGLIRRAIETDWYYFREMRCRLARQYGALPLGSPLPPSAYRNAL